MKFWVKLWRGGKIIANESATISAAVWNGETLLEVFRPVCETLDVALPVLLEKHFKELNSFKRTVFTQDDNIETINYDKLEIEIFEENAPVKYNKNFE